MQHSVLRRVLRRFWEGFWGRVLRRVLRRGPAMGFAVKKGSEKFPPCKLPELARHGTFERDFK